MVLGHCTEPHERHDGWQRIGFRKSSYRARRIGLYGAATDIENWAFRCIDQCRGALQ